jgi:hypothetical protein
MTSLFQQAQGGMLFRFIGMRPAQRGFVIQPPGARGKEADCIRPTLAWITPKRPLQPDGGSRSAMLNTTRTCCAMAPVPQHHGLISPILTCL